MIKHWFNVYFKNRSTILIIGFFVALGMLSFVFSNAPITIYKEMLINPPEDINVENTARIVTEWKAFYHFFNFIYESPLHILGIFAQLAFIGVFISPQYLFDVQSGYGVYYMTRTNYHDYSKTVLVAQGLYLICITAISYALVFLLHFAFSGFQLGVGFVGGMDVHLKEGILLFVAQVALMVIYYLIVNSLTLQLSTFIRNRYVLQGLPLVLFGFVPLTITGTIAKINPTWGGDLVPLSVNYLGVVIKWFLASGNDASIILRQLMSFIVLIAVGFVLYRINTASFTKNYLP